MNDMEELRTIADSKGKQYRLWLYDDANGWIMKIFDASTLAAQLNCIRQGKDLLLCDIIVHEFAVHPIGWFERLRTFFGLEARGRTSSYRNRGLGSALLSYTINRARAQGFRSIIGVLAPRDLAECPYLPIWYRKFSFKVRMESGKLAGRLELALQ